jgi:hypothetical protein
MAVQPDNSQKRNAAIAAMKARKQKKNVYIAIGLIVVMAVLWIRLIAKKNIPEQAVAVVTDPAVLNSATKVHSIVFYELPVVVGRNDVLTKDIFSSNGWKELKAANPGADEANSPYISADITQAVDALELSAIITGNRPQAFIGDKLVANNESFDFIFKDKKYTFRISEINDLQVKLDYCGRTVVKKIVHP